MKITNLTENSREYTSNVYLIMGAWNALEDVTTLIDVGSDPTIFSKIELINTGLGKKKIDQVVLTHSHSDHAGLLPTVKEIYNPKIYANNSFLQHVDSIIKDGDRLRIGEVHFEVFHITSHSNDSICLFNEDEGILMAGDTSFPIEFENEELKNENENTLRRLQTKNIRTVFYGHGPSRNFAKKKFQLIKDE